MVRVLNIPVQTQMPTAQDFRTPPPSDAVQRALADLAGTFAQFRAQSIGREENALERQARGDLQTQALDAASARQAAENEAAAARQAAADDAAIERTGYDVAARRQDAAEARKFAVDQSEVAFGREQELEGLREGYVLRRVAASNQAESAAARVKQQQEALKAAATFEAEIDKQYEQGRASAQQTAPPGHIAALDDDSARRWAEIGQARSQIRSLSTVSPVEFGWASMALSQKAGALHWTVKPDPNVAPNGKKIGEPFDLGGGVMAVNGPDGRVTVIDDRVEKRGKAFERYSGLNMSVADMNRAWAAESAGQPWPDDIKYTPQGGSVGLGDSGLDGGETPQAAGQPAVQAFDATSPEVQSRWSVRQREVSDILGRNYSDPELLNVVSDELHSASIDEFFKMATQFGNVGGVPITQWMSDPANRRLWTAYNATKRAGK